MGNFCFCRLAASCREADMNKLKKQKTFYIAILMVTFLASSIFGQTRTTTITTKTTTETTTITKEGDKIISEEKSTTSTEPVISTTTEPAAEKIRHYHLY
jgi:hypothetical protein